MKVLQVTAPKECKFLELPTPHPRPGEVLMRVNAVTTCPQWDLHLRHNEPMFIGHTFTYPYTPGQPGHEATGVIVEVGEGVTSVKAGDRVSAWRDPGHEYPGCYAQYVRHKAENVIKVPEGIPDEGLAPVELAMCIATVFRELVKMDVIRGRVFGISGLGPAGLVALQMAKAEGADAVVGIDPNHARREYAMRLGASHCIPPGGAIRASLFPQTSIDCVGSQSSVEALMNYTLDVVALFGVQRESYSYLPQHNRLTLLGYKGHFRESAEYAVNLISQGKLDLSTLVTHKLPLERYNEGIELLEQQKAIKICFLPWETDAV
jgi:threonine dehydrogenase-like Zn-dependent dehydrogenase